MLIVSRNITKRRMEKNLKQFELAKLAGISQAYLSHLEDYKSGKRITILTLRKLAKALNCKVGDLTD